MDHPELTLRSDITVELLDFSGGDAQVVRAARVSTKGQGSLGRVNLEASAEGLIGYLMRNRHGSPFEHNLFTFYVNAPIFVLRHLARHRTWSFNEESSRYRELKPVFYMPANDRQLRQVGGAAHYDLRPSTPGQHDLVVDAAVSAYAQSWAAYKQMLDGDVAREVARMVLPVATYSSLYATCNARALMTFLSLRTSSEEAAIKSMPQHETELLALAMESFFANSMPLTYNAFNSSGRVGP